MPEKIWEIGASGWFYYKEIFHARFYQYLERDVL
jgi:hypothetical protein